VSSGVPRTWPQWSPHEASPAPTRAERRDRVPGRAGPGDVSSAPGGTDDPALIVPLARIAPESRPVPRFVLRLRRVAARRPTATQQRGHQQPALIHQQQASVAAAGLVLDARPVLGQPAGDDLVGLFAGHAPGLLRRVPPLPEPGAQGVGMEVRVELLLDALGQARSGPHVRGEARLGGRVGQPAEHDLLLGAGELGWATESAAVPGSQDVVATATGVSQPAPDALWSDLEEGRDLLGRIALGEARDSEVPSALQFVGCTFGSQTRGRRKPRAELTLLT
jgi:hypothetical protein